MNSIFLQGIETENCGMSGGTSYYDIEDLYQAFKERIIEELKIRSSELLNDAELIDCSDS